MMKCVSFFGRQARSRPGITILQSLAAAIFLVACPAPAVQAETAPLRALLITGGGWHDYDGQKEILTEGISARANVAWTVDHEAGKQTDVKLSRFEQPGWAEDFDVVVYNMCFSHVTDPAYVEQIARTHHEGLPAVVIHCAMHSFRTAETEEWRKLLGVTTVRHEGHRPFEVRNLQPGHPVMKGFPDSWKTPKGELYMIEKIWPTATPLAQAYGQDTKKDHVCVWVNDYGDARVFGTTIGHHNETMAEETYLDLVSRGLLWAVNKLDDDGRPEPGFGPGAGDEAAFVPIFNGKDLSGWDGKEQFWRVEDGMIIGRTTPENPTAGNTFLIWRDGEVDDFELKLKYRIASPWANSGIQFRSEDLGNHVVRGYQSDIATEGWISGILYEERGRGVFARRGQRVEAGDGAGTVKVLEEFASSDELGAKIHNEDWNEYHIIARGNHISQKINGHLMAEMIDAGEKESRRSGILAIQLHSGNPMTIQVKDIQLKRLKLTGDQKKVVMVAGTRSHGYGAHEHNAGTLLFKRLLDEGMPNIVSTIYHNGWPKDPTAFDNADAILIYSNGGGGHPVLPHLEQVDKLMRKGVGLLCVHYAVEVPKGDPGKYFLEWIGGYFEPHWSVNPHWTLEETKIAPDHPIARGVNPYVIYDEWYYHMRFPESMEGVTPIVTATPPDSTLNRPDGAHSNNPHVRAKKGQPHHLVWAYERPNGGRGFGFTGGHDHWNWGHPDQRTILLNAIVWAAGGEVPASGVPSPTLTLEDLEANQDYSPPDSFNRDRVRKMLEEWQRTPVSAQ